MKQFLQMILMVAITALASTVSCGVNGCMLRDSKFSVSPIVSGPNACVSFSVTAGTGCAWMCAYCSGALGTNNYYFTDGVCKYESGGCAGNPQAGVMYTCCSV